MNPSSSNTGQQQQRIIGKTSLEEQQQTLLALQQLGWPVLQNIGGLGGQESQQQMELLKQFIKSQASSSYYSIDQHQQQRRIEKELPQKRPSLIHDYCTNATSGGTRYSLIQPHQQAHQMNPATGIGVTSEASYLTEEEEKYKRILNEKLEKIDRERSQATIMKNNAEKKAKACKNLLAKANQEPSITSGIDDSEDNEEDRDGQSSTEALIERIYAENRKKAAAAAPFPPIMTNQNQQTNNRQLMAEDAARLRAEYEQGVQLLPMLVQAMRIQRERRQDILENRRIIYEEQLNVWERKMEAYEKNQKKLARDVKHRELYEKAFIELKKMREEKERNSRIERARMSLAQGGNGLAVMVPSTSTQQTQLEELNEKDVNNTNVEKQQEIDEKTVQAALIPPVFTNPPRRFFDNRNGYIDNALAETQKQLEIFQNAWTSAEKAMFNEKIAIYGKNFAAIAAFLPTKSVKECVQYYYMTKKRNNYKQKFGRRRKKIGRQGYRPPIMPRFGDTDENIQNYGKGCMFVECLLCDSKILVLESLGQQAARQQHIDDFGIQTDEQSSLQQEMPICTKCQSVAQRNKSLNRCPLGSCICMGGKRKMKPARNIPEKFSSLQVDQMRFLIFRLKMPPSTNKCCTHCYKRMAKDIDDLMMGELQADFEAFKNKTIIRKQQQPALMIGDEEDAMEQMEIKPTIAMGGELWAVIEEQQQPPMKELKLDENEAKENSEIKKEVELDEKAASQEMEPLILPRQGSITMGTPARKRNTLLGSVNEGKFENAPIFPTNLLVKSSPNEVENSAAAQTGLESAATIEGILAQFDLNSYAHSKEATAELTRQLGGMLGSLPPQWLNNLHAQNQQQLSKPNNTETISTAPGKCAQQPNEQQPQIEAENQPIIGGGHEQSGGEHDMSGQARRNSESMRRKSGLATVILPSPAAPDPAPSSSINAISRMTATSAAAVPSTSAQTRPTALSPSVTVPYNPLEKEKPKLEQRDSTLTTKSNETAGTSKTESNQGQQSSCYESLSDDSEEEEKAAMSTRNQATAKPDKQTADPTSIMFSSSSDPSTTAATSLPAFFTVFDFPEDDSAATSATAECQPRNPGATTSSANGTNQIGASTEAQPNIPSKISARQQPTGNADGNTSNHPMYEPLSSDEEN